MDKLNVREVAIEFAKYLMQTEVAKSRSGVSNKIEIEYYIPHEFKLMHGELIQNGTELFEEFYNSDNNG